MCIFGHRFLRVNKVAVMTPQLNVRDLIEDEDYEFRVIAENDAGEGRPSDSTGIVKAKDPFRKPGKPGTPEVTLRDDTAHLSWRAPHDDGKAAIFNYVIEYRQVGDIRWRCANTGVNVKDTEYTVLGLVADRAYEYRVSAENKAGVGAPSGTSSAVKYGEPAYMTSHRHLLIPSLRDIHVLQECTVIENNTCRNVLVLTIVRILVLIAVKIWPCFISYRRNNRVCSQT